MFSIAPFVRTNDPERVPDPWRPNPWCHALLPSAVPCASNSAASPRTHFMTLEWRMEPAFHKLLTLAGLVT